MAISTDQIQELLGQGLSNEVVATAVGCTTSYITQLMSEDTFLQKVIALRAANLQANTKRDRSIDSLEDRLIEKFSDMIPYITKPMEILAAMRTTNAMIRRGVSSTDSTVINQTVVNLTMPTNIMQNFVKNSQGEVVEVAGKTLVTMPAHQLLNNLEHKAIEERDAKTLERYRKVGKSLPNAPASSTEERIAALRRLQSSTSGQLTSNPNESNGASSGTDRAPDPRPNSGNAHAEGERTFG